MSMGGLSAILLIVGCLRGESAPSACGTPSSPTTTSGVECSGCGPGSGVQGVIDTVLAQQSAKDEKGCLAAVMGASTQIKGYPCVTMKGTGASFTCSIHQSCGTKTADSATKSCIYTSSFSGVTALTDCPADSTCTTTANSQRPVWSLAVAAFAISALIQ